MYRPIVAPIQKPAIGAKIHHEDPRDGLIVEGVCRQSQPYNRPDGRHRGRHGYTENVGDEDAKSDEKEDGDASRERNFNRDDPLSQRIHHVPANSPSTKKDKERHDPRRRRFLDQTSTNGGTPCNRLTNLRC